MTTKILYYLAQLDCADHSVPCADSTPYTTVAG